MLILPKVDIDAVVVFIYCAIIQCKINTFLKKDKGKKMTDFWFEDAIGCIGKREFEPRDEDNVEPSILLLFPALGLKTGRFLKT